MTEQQLTEAKTSLNPQLKEIARDDSIMDYVTDPAKRVTDPMVLFSFKPDRRNHSLIF